MYSLYAVITLMMATSFVQSANIGDRWYSSSFESGSGSDDDIDDSSHSSWSYGPGPGYDRPFVKPDGNVASTFANNVISSHISVPSYGPGPRYNRPFTNPGEIVDGITVEEIVQTVGDGWNAETLLQSANIACERLGSDLADFFDQIRQNGIVEGVCSNFDTGELETGCGSYWDLATYNKESAFSLVPVLQCRERYDDYDYYNYNMTDYIYTPIADVGKQALRIMGDFDLYNPCSETGINKINNIVFALMDWFGPSVYTNIYRGEIEPYSVCGILRYILSMDTVEYVIQYIKLVTYPAADILESLQSIDICALSKFDDALPIRVAKQLLIEYSDLSEFEFCDFISKPQTREAYLELGETMVINLISTLVDEETCNNVLYIVAPLDQQGIHINITGFDLTIAHERTSFCKKASEVLSPNFEYVPKPYSLPVGVDLDDVEPFKRPGEILPGLTFIDLLKIEGATYRAEKIVDGIAVYCIVFEEFVSNNIPKDTFDVSGLCDSFKSQDTGSIEDVCLNALVTGLYGYEYPIGLRTFYPLPVALYTARELSGIADISKSEICEALDNTLRQLSLRDVVKTTIDIFLTEATPSLNGVCENFEAAICFWKPYCPEPEQPDASSSESEEVTGFPSYYFYQYIPSPEEIASAHAEFDEKFAIVRSLLLTISGFNSQEELCDVVAKNINPLSGRSDRTLAEAWRSNIIGVLTDVRRCSEAVDITMRLLSERDLQHILTDGNTNPVYQLTGYQSSENFCQAVADAFGTGVPMSTQANVKLVGTYNIFAKIAIYAQRVARSL